MKQNGKSNEKAGNGPISQKSRKSLKDDNRRMKKERDKWKKRCKDSERELKKAKAELAAARKLQELAARSREKVARHGYSKLAASVCTKIRSNTSCSGRDVVKVLEIVNEATGGLLGDDIPCANTIDNWCDKCGLHEYNTAARRFEGKPYAMVIDDSMVVGGQRLLLALLVPAAHTGRPLTHGDVAMGGMYVAKSFDSEHIRKALVETAEKMGRKPEYVISDNASVMLKGAKLSGLPHHSDITHTLGMFLERAYKKEEDFLALNKQVSDVFFKCNMLPAAYLLPPKQRSISRFINMDRWVCWAHSMLHRAHLVPHGERDLFAFIGRNASLIEELYETVSCVRHIETVCKRRGLSKETAAECMSKVDCTQMRGNDRMRRVGSAIKDFLAKETESIGEAKHNNSSDIIESTFGIYKGMKSPNKMYGVTSLVLRLPLCGKTNDDDFDAEQALVSTKMRDIKKWKNENLPQNLVTKRLKFFKMAV